MKLPILVLWMLSVSLPSLAQSKSFGPANESVVITQDLLQTPEVSQKILELEQKGWKVSGSQTILLHKSWVVMGQRSEIVLLNVAVVGNRYMRTNNILAVFATDFSGKFVFKRFLDPHTIVYDTES